MKKKIKKIDVKKATKEWEIWDKEEKAAKLEEEAKNLVPPRFHKWIHIFRKKVSNKMLVKKMWNHTIKLKKGFILRKRKIYLLLREKRREMCKFIDEQFVVTTTYYKDKWSHKCYKLKTLELVKGMNLVLD